MNTREGLMKVIDTKGQQTVSISRVFKHFGYEPPTQEEIRQYIESKKK